MSQKNIEVTILESLNHLLVNHPSLLPIVYEIVHDNLGLPKDQVRWLLGQNRIPLVDINQFVYDEQLGVEHDIRSKYNFEGDLARIYADNKGYLVHKWHHY